MLPDGSVVRCCCCCRVVRLMPAGRRQATHTSFALHNPVFVSLACTQARGPPGQCSAWPASSTRRRNTPSHQVRSQAHAHTRAAPRHRRRGRGQACVFMPAGRAARRQPAPRRLLASLCSASTPTLSPLRSLVCLHPVHHLCWMPLHVFDTTLFGVPGTVNDMLRFAHCRVHLAGVQCIQRLRYSAAFQRLGQACAVGGHPLHGRML